MTAGGRLDLALRWLLLAHLAMGLVVQPILRQVGDLHDQTHRAAAARGPVVAEQPTERGIAAALHRLHQLALCYGPAAPAPQAVLSVTGIGRHWLAMAPETRTYAHEHRVAPFRPPIAG